MKRSLVLVATLAAFGCAELRDLRKPDEPRYQNPFYAKYLTSGTALDAQIARTLDRLRADEQNPQLHNELGALLVQKGFPKDAEVEFERAINIDTHYYQAWYNLGLVREARGDEGGARRAFERTVRYKPGHPMGLFQLGLREEQAQHTDRAIALYAKAMAINPSLMEPDVNPRVLDSRLMHRVLIAMYGKDHARETMQFQGVSGPAPKKAAAPAAGPSPEAAPAQIVPPTAPATDPSKQPRRPKGN